MGKIITDSGAVDYRNYFALNDFAQNSALSNFRDMSLIAGGFSTSCAAVPAALVLRHRHPCAATKEFYKIMDDKIIFPARRKQPYREDFFMILIKTAPARLFRLLRNDFARNDFAKNPLNSSFPARLNPENFIRIITP